MAKNTTAKTKIQNINANGLILIGSGAGYNELFFIVNAPLFLNLLLTLFEQLFFLEVYRTGPLGIIHIRFLLILLFSYFFHLFSWGRMVVRLWKIETDALWDNTFVKEFLFSCTSHHEIEKNNIFHLFPLVKNFRKILNTMKYKK